MVAGTNNGPPFVRVNVGKRVANYLKASERATGLEQGPPLGASLIKCMGSYENNTKSCVRIGRKEYQLKFSEGLLAARDCAFTPHV